MAELQSYPKEMSEKGAHPIEEQPVELPPLDEIKKGRWERSWPTIACGAGLFSDGYLNAVCCVSCSPAATLSHMAVQPGKCLYIIY
jgi:hypothetical protein